jgi:hypothetical protein
MDGVRFRDVAMVACCFALSEGVMAQTFVAETADRSHEIRVPVPLDRAMRLFEPEGEKQWAKGWSPNYIAPSDGTTLEGMVFTTRHGDHETIWLMSRDRRAEGRVEYVRTTPGHWLATVYVDARDDGEGTTKVAVRYRYAALSEEGNAYVRAMDDSRFAATIATWESAIRAALAR